MAKSSVATYGAEGEKKILLIATDNLKLVTDEKHPLFDARVHLPVREPMVLSIMEHGIIEPIMICKDPETADNLVVFGRQRVKNCIEANRRLKKEGRPTHPVPCQVVRGSSDGGYLLTMTAIENELREEDTPSGRAHKARRLAELGRTEKQISIAMGVSESTVKNMFNLLEATAVVRGAVDSGKISTTTGYQLAKLPPEAQRAKLGEILEAAPRLEKADGKKRAKRGSGKKAREIASGRVAMRAGKDVTAMRGQLKKRISDVRIREAVLTVLDWVLGTGDLKDLLVDEAAE